MKYPSSEFDAAVAAVCHGTATDDELAELYALLRANPAAQDEYVWQVELHARLASLDPVVAWPGAVQSPVVEAARDAGLPSAWARQSRVTAIAGVATGLLGLAAAIVAAVLVRPPAGVQPGPAAALAARFTEVDNARWVANDVEHHAGEEIHSGQRLELSAGRVRLQFASGASAVLEGPAILDVESGSAGFLVLGRVTVTADTPESKGFTIRTRTARVVDLGTEFTAQAGADGLSWFGVISGEVEVHRDGVEPPQRLVQGEMLSLEAGREQVMVRVERGDETPRFAFSSIEPPSDRDYADARQGQASLRVVSGVLNPNSRRGNGGSGPVEVLFDGRGQSGADKPEESLFFENEQPGQVLMDLGKSVTVSKINTYTWHQNGLNPDNRLRALQCYTLYGSAADAPPPTDGDLAQDGWVAIARVNTDDFFRVVRRIDRPAQQGCSITSGGGTIGRYRYLLWAVQPSRYPDFKQRNNSFYGEFDVYAQP